MNKLSKERILLSILLLFIGLLFSIFAVNKYLPLHNYMELIIFLITPIGIIVSALFLIFNCSIKAFLRVASITTLTSSVGLMLIAGLVNTSASELASSPDSMLPGLNFLGTVFLYLAVVINIGVALLSLIAGGMGLGSANGYHLCTGTAIFSSILMLIALITNPYTLGHTFQLLILAVTVICYKSNHLLQTTTEDIINTNDDGI